MESFDRLFRRYLRTAVLLHHPYPPHTGRRTSSKFGGLPTLPAHYDWPRNSDGVPLHFLVQVDCAEIPFRTALPERGMLFFFGRDDEEQYWQRDPPSNNCRVVYALDAFAATPPRDAPADLQPIGGVSRTAPERPFLRLWEAGSNLHVEWPIQPLPIDTWPGALHAYPGESDPKWLSFADWGRHLFGSKRAAASARQQAEERGRQYQESLRSLRADAFARATGEPWEVRDVDMPRDVGLAIFGHDENGPEAYPQYWITLHYAVRSVLFFPYQMGQVRGSAEEERVLSTGGEWLRRSEEHDLDEPVSGADRADFRTWLAGIRRWRGEEHALLSLNAAEHVVHSLAATIRAWAGDALRAARLSPWIYSQMRFAFSGAYSQMLGHSPASDNATSVDEPAICLLNLASDGALGRFFDEAGYGSFWIEPDDLARRDFSKVVGIVSA